MEDELIRHREAIIYDQSKVHNAHAKAFLELKSEVSKTSDKFQKQLLTVWKIRSTSLKHSL